MVTKRKSPEEEQEQEIAALVRALPQDPALRAYRVIYSLELPLPIGAIPLIAAKLKIARWRVDNAAALCAAFAADPEARAEWEEKVLAGVVTVRRALARVRAKKPKEEES